MLLVRAGAEERVPGLVAGRYRAEELEIDVLPLARRAGARVVLAPMVGLDAQRRTVLVADRPPIPFDVASLDIGSSVAGLDLPGVRQHALATRPIGRFVSRLAEALIYYSPDSSRGATNPASHGVES